MSREPAGCRISHERAGAAMLLRGIPSARDPLGGRMRRWIAGIGTCRAALLVLDEADRPVACIGIAPWIECGRTDRVELHAAAIGGAGSGHAALRRIPAWLTLAPALVGATGAVVDLPAARTDLIAMCHRVGFRCFRVARRGDGPWILASMPMADDANAISIDARGRFDRRAWVASLPDEGIRVERMTDPPPVRGLTARAAEALDLDPAARTWLRLGPRRSLASSRTREAILRTVRFWSAPAIGESWVVAERKAAGRRDGMILADAARVLRSATSLGSLRTLCEARSTAWTEACLSPVGDPGLLAVLGLNALGTSVNGTFTFVEPAVRGGRPARGPTPSPPRKLPA